MLGSQAPRFSHVPTSKWTEVDEAEMLAASYGLTPDPWQRLVLTAWLGHRLDGKWSAGRCGLAVPRQNGKNGALEVRELYGMVVLGEKFLHTAHQVKTARKAFLRLLHFFGDEPNDPNAKHPELNELVVEVRKTNGQEAIVLSNGGSVEFVARSKSSGRGFTVDVLVLDEAQDLTDEDVEALQPVVSSAPLGNPQTILTGTPPPPNSPVGLVWTRMRDMAWKRDAKRLAWHEWSVAGDVDIFDRQYWAATNPSLGRRLQESVVEDELPPALSVEGFARERLGRWWDPKQDVSIFPGDGWGQALDVDSKPDGPRVFAVDLAPDSTSASIAGCSRRVDGLIHGQLVQHAEGTGWVVDRVVELIARWGQHAPVALCGRSAAGLKDKLEENDVEVHVLTAVEWIAACRELYTSVVGTPAREVEDEHGVVTIAPAEPADLKHTEQTALDGAVRSAIRKNVTGGWYWAPSPSGLKLPINPLTALTGARWALARIPEDEDYDVLESIW